MSALIRHAIDAVNNCNRTGKHSPDFRHGQNTLLETLLHRANCYAGFGYLRAQEVPATEQPGIIYDESADRQHTYPDDSRRFYYVHGKLQGKDCRSARLEPAIPATVTPTLLEKSEWSRMAQAAYRADQNQIGHLYSTAASLATGDRLPTARFDALQAGYREWLVFNRFPAAAA